MKAAWNKKRTNVTIQTSFLHACKPSITLAILGGWWSSYLNYWPHSSGNAHTARSTERHYWIIKNTKMGRSMLTNKLSYACKVEESYILTDNKKTVTRDCTKFFCTFSVGFLQFFGDPLHSFCWNFCPEIPIKWWRCSTLCKNWILG